MNREMKCRAWNAHKNEWFDPALIKVSLDFSVIGLWCGSELGYVFNDIASWNIVIQQYTGLKDKNGVEIYEGDIVKLKSIIHENLMIDSVSYSNNEAAFILSEIGYFLNETALEVIGNIFENPELLKK